MSDRDPTELYEILERFGTVLDGNDMSDLSTPPVVREPETPETCSHAECSDFDPTGETCLLAPPVVQPEELK
jgi:hypothetical protein